MVAVKGTFMGHQVAVEALVGSHNYNLNTENSDKDWKYFVTPTFDDLYNGVFFSDAKQSTEVDYSAHDIRQLGNLVWKSNLNFLEVLFSKHLTIRPELDDLFERAEYFSTGNIPAFWSATMGMHFEKMASLHKGTATTQRDVDKYGYDPKQAHHALRCLFVLQRFYERKSMGMALWFDTFEPQRKILLEVKNGEWNEEKFQGAVREWHNIYRPRVEAWYKTQVAKPEVKIEIDKIIKDFVRENLSR